MTGKPENASYVSFIGVRLFHVISIFTVSKLCAYVLGIAEASLEFLATESSYLFNIPDKETTVWVLQKILTW